MIDFTSFSDELQKIAKEKERPSGLRDAALVSGGALAGGLAVPTLKRTSEAVGHSKTIADAAAAGKKGFTLKYLRPRGYTPYAIGGALAGGAATGYALHRRGKKK